MALTPLQQKMGVVLKPTPPPQTPPPSTPSNGGGGGTTDTRTELQKKMGVVLKPGVTTGADKPGEATAKLISIGGGISPISPVGIEALKASELQAAQERKAPTLTIVPPTEQKPMTVLEQIRAQPGYAVTIQKPGIQTGLPEYKRELFPGLFQAPVRKAPELDISKFAAYPVYKGLTGISETAQKTFESVIGYKEGAPLHTEFVAGVGSAVTMLPSMMGAGLMGVELATKKPLEFGRSFIPGAKVFDARPTYLEKGITKMATDLYQQFQEKPVFTLGQVSPMFLGARGVKGIKSEFKPAKIEAFLKSESAELMIRKRPVTQLQLLERPKAATEPPVSKIPVIDFRGADIFATKHPELRGQALVRAYRESVTEPLKTASPNIQMQELYKQISTHKQEAIPKTITVSQIEKFTGRPYSALKGSEILKATKTLREMPELTKFEVTTKASMKLPFQIAAFGVLAKQRPMQTAKPMSVFKPTSKIISISKALQKQTPLLKTRQILGSSQIPRLTAIQKPITIQALKVFQVPQQIPRQTPKFKPLETSILKPLKIKKPQKAKRSMFESSFKFGGKGKTGFGKFPELAKIASTTQILKGFSMTKKRTGKKK